MKRRIGKFQITREIIEQNPEAVQEVFKLCIPVNIDYMFHTDSLEYTAISERFDEIEIGECAPYYMFRVDMGMGVNPTITAIRLDNYSSPGPLVFDNVKI